MSWNSVPVNVVYEALIDCDDGSGLATFPYYFKVRADTAISAGYSISPWVLSDSTSGSTLSIGSGYFVEPDLNQNNYTVATSALPTWLSWNGVTRVFTVTANPSTDTSLFTNRVMTITLTATDGGNSSITATNSF